MKSILAAFVFSVLATQVGLAAQEAAIMTCVDQASDPGYQLHLFTGDKGEFNAELYIHVEGGTQAVLPLQVCNVTDEHSGIPGNVVGCNNVDWQERWNVSFTLAELEDQTHMIVADVYYNEELSTTMVCK